MEEFTFVTWLVDWLGLPPSWAGPYLHISMSAVVLILITACSLVVYRRLRKPDFYLVPEDRPTMINTIEIIIEALLRIMRDVMGEDARRHLPIVGAVFIYILVSNLIGVVPGFACPTENMNTNLACALVVFVYYNYVGIRAHGFKGYLKDMAGPIIWLAPLMFAIELISQLVRPLSLSVRLFGNMFGDHMVLGMFSQLAPVVVPVLFMALTIFIAFIQAFVFTLLTIVYIALATRTR